jgi:hypothetical protein
VPTGTGNDAVDCGAATDTAQVDGGRNTNVGNRCEVFAP